MKLRPNIKHIDITYFCPTDEVDRTVRIEPSAEGLHAESEECSHCGYEESCTYHHAECECGGSHFLHLLARTSG